jgi:hypothetical protein
MTIELTGLERAYTDSNSSSDDELEIIQQGTSCGRVFTVVGNGCCAAGRGMQKTINGLHALSADSNATAAIFRKLKHLFNLGEHLTNTKGSLTKCATFLNSHVGVIDFFQMAADAHYFVCGKFRQEKNSKGEVTKARDSNWMIGARLSLCAANTVGALLWLQEMGAKLGEFKAFSLVQKTVSSIPKLRDMPKLQKAAAAIGNIRIFGFLAGPNVLFFVLRGLDLGYALLAVDAGKRIHGATNSAQRTSAAIDISSYLSELVLSALLLAGVTNVIGLGVAGATCIALATSSFLYRVTHNKEIKEKPQLNAHVLTN